jgi:hypothetical protein
MSETWSRRLRLLLVISLALNLFFIGPSPFRRHRPWVRHDGFGDPTGRG